MKKTKVILFATALLALSACSSDDDTIAPVPQPNAEVLPSVPIQQGSLSVTAGMEGDNNAKGTRARIVEEGTEALKGFRLFGAFDPDGTNRFFLGGTRDADGNIIGANVGVAYAKNAEGKWFTNNKNTGWPVDTTKVNNFYGISVQGDSLSMVNYAPADYFSNEYSQYWGIPNTFKLINADAQFDYAVPLNVVDQKDLLLSKVLNSKQKDDYGAITLGFKHALACITLQMRFNATEWDATSNQAVATGNGQNLKAEVESGYKLGIDYIVLHNFYTKGTYFFKEDKWTVPENGACDIKIDFSKSPLIFTAGEATADNKIPYQDITLNNDSMKVFVIPQDVPSQADMTASDITSNKAPYIEVHAVCWNPTTSWYKPQNSQRQRMTTPFDSRYSKTDLNNFLAGDTKGGVIYDTNDDHFCRSIYYALPKKLTKFEGNKEYNFRLNIYNAVRSDGQKVLTGGK